MFHRKIRSGKTGRARGSVLRCTGVYAGRMMFHPQRGNSLAVISPSHAGNGAQRHDNREKKEKSDQSGGHIQITFPFSHTPGQTHW